MKGNVSSIVALFMTAPKLIIIKAVTQVNTQEDAEEKDLSHLCISDAIGKALRTSSQKQSLRD